MVGDSRDGKVPPGAAPETGSSEPDGGGTPVFGGVSDAELDVFVGKLRTDKNPRVPAASASRVRGDVHGERLHKGVRRSLVSSVLEEAPAPVSAPAEKHAWFVVLGANSVGPLDEQALKGHWERGELGPDSMCWRKGFAAWLPLGQVPELIETFAPLPQELSAAVDAALSALADGPDLAPLSQAAASVAPVVIAAPQVVSVPVDPVGAHAVLAEVTAASEQVEARWRLSGWWYTLAGGVAGGVTVALVMGLMGGWSGISAVLSRTKDVAPVAVTPAVPSPVAPVVNAAPVPSAPAPVADASQTAGVPAAVGGAAVAAVEKASAARASEGSSAMVGGGGAARPSLTGVAAVERGGALPVMAPTGGGLATSLVGTSSTSRVEREVEPAPRVAAVAPRMPEMKLGSSKKPTAPPPAPTAASANVPSQPASDDDLGLDEDFDRALSGPVAGSGRREAPRTAYVPPVAPIQNPRVTLTQSDVFEVVLAKKGEVTSCANAKPRPVDEGTRVVVRWTILPSGEVDEVVTETASLKGTAFARCIEGRVRAWVFPKHQEQGGAVRFPFVF
ncbi:AgmX/PglI C-terminal domain-containing protein [Myxococcus stipitatus]|uniref:AgmX/PglI C-terminal domain-containing protein n=1 Tax=Myxococcus stipitatus TaxID=83455 RepID=UPI0030CCDBB3